MFLDQLAAERAGHLLAGNVYLSLGTVCLVVWWFVWFFGQHCEGAGVCGIHGSGIAGPRPNGIRNCWDWMDYYYTSRERIALHMSNSEGNKRGKAEKKIGPGGGSIFM